MRLVSLFFGILIISVAGLVSAGRRQPHSRDLVELTRDSEVTMTARRSASWFDRVAILANIFLVAQFFVIAYQVKLLRQEATQRENDTEIVRRAQLLATIYDCVPTAGDSIANAVPWCEPLAHARARAEAVRSFVTIEAKGREWINLSGADLSGLDFTSPGLTLRDVGDVRFDLSGAYLKGAFLSDAELGRAVLERAVISEAKLDGADLVGADLSGAILLNTILSGASLNGGILYSVKADGVDLEGADLSNANLGSAELKGANFSKAILTNAILTGADLSDAVLEASHGEGVILTGADLRRVDFHGARLLRAFLEDADLGEALLVEADLSNATLVNADLRGALFSGSILDGARLDGADLSLARDLTEEQIESALGSEATQLPEGMSRPLHWH